MRTVHVEVRRADTGEIVGGSVSLEDDGHGVLHFLPPEPGVYTLDHMLIDGAACRFAQPFKHTVLPASTRPEHDPLDHADKLVDALTGASAAMNMVRLPLLASCFLIHAA